MLKQIASNFGIVLFSGLTLASTSMGVIKVFEKPSSINNQPQINETIAPQIPTPSDNPNAFTNDNFSTNNSTGSSVNSNTNSQPNNSQNANLINNTPNQSSSTNNNRCIVTLWSKQYDVTPLKSQHPGGDIFVCGTDMTSAYQAQHGTNLSRMQAYLISSNTTTPSHSIPTPTATPIIANNSSGNTNTGNNPNNNPNNNNNRCIVTLSGQQYDVTPLKSQHPGGDIFVCGTDMTAVYQGQHGTNLSRMQAYLVPNNTTGSGSTGGTTNNQGNQSPQNPQNNPQSDDDDRQEKEHEREDDDNDEHEDDDRNESKDSKDEEHEDESDD